MANRTDKADSPCIAVCAYLPDSKVCRGCFRRIEEIWDWRSLDANERRDVLKKARRRKDEYLAGGGFSV